MSSDQHSHLRASSRNDHETPGQTIEGLKKGNAVLTAELTALQRTWTEVQEVMTASSIAILFLDRELRIASYTPSALRLFNFLPSDIGRPFSDLTHRLDYGTMLEDARAVLDTFSPCTREIKGPDKCWLLVRLTSYTRSTDAAVGVALTFIDITERKKAEDVLRNSEYRIRGTITQNSTGILISDLSGKLSFVNQKLCELLNTTEDDLLGVPYWEILREESMLHRKVIGEANEVASPLQIEKRLKRKNGSFFWANISVSLIHDHEGAPLSVVAVFIDTTDRKLAEEALRASRQRLHAIFSEATVGLSELAVDGRFLRINNRICEILGRSRDELLQMSAATVTHSDDLPATLSAVQAVLKTGRPHSVEKRYVRPDGSFIWANSAFSRLDDDDGNARAILVVTADISEQKEAENQLRLAGEERERHVVARTHQLNDANRELRKQIAERLAAEQARQKIARQLVTAQERERSRISRELHDEVGQHLTGLMLGIKALSSSSVENPKELLQKLLETTELIGKEIHDLAVELRPTSLDDLGLLRALTNYIADWSIRTKIPVDFHHSEWPDKRLPPHIETVIYRIICEALNNVYKHACADSVSVILELRDSQIGVIIEDTGTGFDEEPMTASSQRKTLGILGMKERAALVDGELEIESVKGKGTTVFLRIPHPYKSKHHE